MAVRRADGKTPEDEECSGQGKAEDDQQQIGPGKEKRTGKHRKEKEQDDIEILEFVDQNPLFLKKLQNVEKGLPQRRAVSALEPGAQFPVGPGEKPSHQRGEHEKNQHPRGNTQRLVYVINSVHMNATPNITQNRTMETRTPTLNRRSSPKYFSR